jgi:hypothetical protein
VRGEPFAVASLLADVLCLRDQVVKGTTDEMFERWVIEEMVPAVVKQLMLRPQYENNKNPTCTLFANRAH